MHGPNHPTARYQDVLFANDNFLRWVVENQSAKEIALSAEIILITAYIDSMKVELKVIDKEIVKPEEKSANVKVAEESRF